MSGFTVTAAFEHIEETGEIGVEIGVWIFQRVAHAGLRGEMNDRTECTIAKTRFGAFAVGKIEPVKAEFAELPQHREPGFLERRVVIVIDAVDADDGAAAFEQPARQREADKARGAGDENRLLRHRYAHNRHNSMRAGRVPRSSCDFTSSTTPPSCLRSPASNGQPPRT